MGASTLRLSMLAAALGLAGVFLLGGCGSGSKKSTAKAVRCVRTSDCPDGTFCQLGTCVPGEFVPPGDDEPQPGDTDAGDIDGDEGDAAAGDGDAEPGDAAGDSGDGDSSGADGDNEPGDGGDSGPCGGGCTGRQVCDTGSSLCIEPLLCTGSIDCVPPNTCNKGLCMVGGTRQCTVTGDCALGLVCDGSGLCQSCNPGMGLDCPGSQVCTGGSCEEAATCTTADDCYPTHVCSGSSSTCVDPTCVNDAFDPADFASRNDVAARATNLGTLSSPAWDEGIVLSLVLCEPDTDWFLLPTAAHDGVLVRVSYIANRGRIEVRLFCDPGDPPIAANVVPNGVAFLLVEDAPCANPLLEVFDVDGTLINYNLRVNSVAGGLCIEDEFEPNDSIAAAYELELDSPSDGQLCGGNEDWFKVTLAGAGALNLTLDSADASVPAVEVFAGNLTTKVLRDTSPWAKNLEATTEAAVDYYIRVFRFDGPDKNRYTIGVSIE